jgi:hypothetical protein
VLNNVNGTLESLEIAALIHGASVPSLPTFKTHRNLHAWPSDE